MSDKNKNNNEQYRIPTSKIKELFRLVSGEETCRMSKEATVVLSSAASAFLEELLVGTNKILNGAKILKVEHIHEVLDSDDKFDFLKTLQFFDDYQLKTTITTNKGLLTDNNNNNNNNIAEALKR